MGDVRVRLLLGHVVWLDGPPGRRRDEVGDLLLRDDVRDDVEEGVGREGRVREGRGDCARAAEDPVSARSSREEGKEPGGRKGGARTVLREVGDLGHLVLRVRVAHDGEHVALRELLCGPPDPVRLGRLVVCQGGTSGELRRGIAAGDGGEAAHTSRRCQ